MFLHAERFHRQTCELPQNWSQFSAFSITSAITETRSCCRWRAPAINTRCQHQCHCFILDPALTMDPNEVKLYSCNKPNVSLVKQTELTSCISPKRVHAGDCLQPLSEVSTPIYLTPNTTSTCPTVTGEVSSGKNRRDLPHTHAWQNWPAPACVAQINMCLNTHQNQPKLYSCSSVQCWSSRGKRRGQCWCVDQSGLQVSSTTGEKGSLVC